MITAFTDYVMNGQGFGIGEQLAGARFDPGMMRPYFSRIQGRTVPCVTINTGRSKEDAEGNIVPVYKKIAIARLHERGIPAPTLNATSLRKEQWIQMDKAVLRAARQRLRAVADLEASNTYSTPGMSKLTLEYEAMSDPGEALVDMDGLAEGRQDSPLFKLRSIPLPITHADFWFSARRLAVSRNGGEALDTTMAEACGRRIAEKLENILIGNELGMVYGTQTAGYGTHDGSSAIYGYTNHPNRVIRTNFTAPTGSNPEATVANFLSAKQTMRQYKFYGPFMVYTSGDWDEYLDNDYARLGGSNANMTLRERLKKIDGIQDVRSLDYLTSTFTMIFVQMTSDVARMINGMDISTVQWESQGGARVNFKVMCIKVPQIRFDYNGVAAVLHATTA